MDSARTKPPTQADPGRLLLSTPADSRIAAYLLGGVLFAVWTWWALVQGAFFGRVLLPGGVLIYAALALTLGWVRLPVSSRGPHAVALAAFFGFAAWTALSMLWTPTQDLALDYAQRAFIYATAFAAGLLFTVALRRRMILSLVPFLAAGAVVVVVVLIRVWLVSTVEPVVDLEGTFDFPFDYRNANAGFFTMLAFCSMPVIARAKTSLPLRVGMAALASTSLSLAVISQSRGSLLAAVAGLVALLIFAPRRPSALVSLIVVFAPVILLFPQLLDPYEAAGTPTALSELQGAMTASLSAGVIAAVLTVGAIGLERRGVGIKLPQIDRRRGLVALVGTSLVLLASITLLLGNPITEVKDQLDSASSGEPSYGDIEGSRFTYGGGLNRLNFWSVALGQARSSPILGEGAGSFRSTYLVEGNGSEEPRDAHSLPLEALGELGLVGLILLCVAFGASILALLRSRRLGPDSATLSTVALVGAAVALAQAAVDWSWFFGGQIGPLFALLGSAAAPAALAFEPLPRRMCRGFVLAAGLVTAAVVPTFASERLTFEAARGWRSDLGGAYGALSTAASLNPFADSPLLVEAQIARESGDVPRALLALEEAERREPENWQSYLLGAQVLKGSDPASALVELERARALNPSSEQVAALRKNLLKKVQDGD